MSAVTPVRLRAKSESEGDADGGSDQAGDRALAEKERADLPAGGAERAQDPDLRAALRDRDGERIVDDEHSDEQREHAGDVHREGVDAEQRFELPAAARGRLDGEAGAEQRAERGLALIERDAILRGRYRCGRSGGRGRTRFCAA